MKISSLDLDDVKSVTWIEESQVIQLLDQRLFPWKIKFKNFQSVEEICSGIRDMAVRGAPAIGITAAYAVLLAIKETESILNQEKRKKKFTQLFHQILNTRPTAIDLKNYTSIIYNLALETDFNYNLCVERAKRLEKKVLTECKLIGEKGELLIEDGDVVLTHCHAGAAATVDYGTALAPFHKAKEKSKNFTVIVDETRPRLQGAKITAWELFEAGIDHFIISDNSATFLMSLGKIDKIIVGADRCLTDGTVTNKIGTLSLAVSANHYNIPFYSAFPWSTIDFLTDSRNDIEIEQRTEEEVKYISGKERTILVANKDSPALNYAFDITPPELITGYITPKGILSVDELKQEVKKIGH